MNNFSSSRIALLLALVFGLAFPSLALAEDGQGIFISQVGIGAAMPSYPSAVEYLFSAAESSPGVDRIKFSLDIAAGLSVSPGYYIMARIDGMGDRVFDSADYLQLNLYLYSMGLRAYLPESGLYAEAGAGGSRAIASSSTGGSSASDFDFGYALAMGYSFSRSRRGIGLGLEARYLGLSIDNESCGGLMLTVNLCWQ